MTYTIFKGKCTHIFDFSAVPVVFLMTYTILEVNSPHFSAGPVLWRCISFYWLSALSHFWLIWADRQSTFASVQRPQSTLASHSTFPRATNVKQMNANRAIRIGHNERRVREDYFLSFVLGQISPSQGTPANRMASITFASDSTMTMARRRPSKIYIFFLLSPSTPATFQGISIGLWCLSDTPLLWPCHVTQCRAHSGASDSSGFGYVDVSRNTPPPPHTKTTTLSHIKRIALHGGVASTLT